MRGTVCNLFEQTTLRAIEVKARYPLLRSRMRSHSRALLARCVCTTAFVFAYIWAGAGAADNVNWL